MHSQRGVGLAKKHLVSVVLTLMVALCIYEVSQYALADILTLIDRVVVDDTFYYLGVGRNIVAGNGVTFDGLNRTNGVEPLWQLIILPIFVVTSDPVRQVQLTVALSGMLHTAAGLLIFFVMKRLLAATWALLAAYLWLLNPSIFKIDLMGMETSLSALVFAGLCFILINWRNKLAAGPLAYSFALGIFAGLVALARFESTLLLPLVAMYLLFKARNAGSSIREIAKRLGVLGLGWLLLVGPYLTLNLVAFGTLTPVSGQAKFLYEFGSAGFPKLDLQLFQTLLGQSQRYGQYVFDLVFSKFALQADTWLFTQWSIVFPWRYMINIFASGMLLGAILLYFHGRRHPDPEHGAPVAEITLIAAFVLLHFVFVAAFLYGYALYNTWYFSSEFVLLVLGSTYVLANSYDRLFRPLFVDPRIPQVCLAAGIAYLCIVQPANVIEMRNDLSKVADPATSTVVRFYEATLWMNQNLPEKSRIGSFSAGIVGFFSRHRVVNLDGFANSETYLEYLRKGLFRQYVDEMGINYVADYFTYDPTRVGIGWDGLLPAENLVLVNHWALPDDKTYFVLEYRK